MLVIRLATALIASAFATPLAAETAPMVRGFCVARPASPNPAPPSPSQANALTLLGSLTQLDSPLGRKVLESNLTTTITINNTAPPAVRRQALRDAQVTAANAFALADGLGPTMGDAYRRTATFTSPDDGRTIEAKQIGPAVADLVKAAMRTAGGDSGEAKCAFANGVEPHQHGTWQPPSGGVLDVLGKAYRLPAGAPGGDPFGNPRPFQVAPLDTAGSPRIESFEATDFFGVPMSSRVLLEGATPADITAGRWAESLADSPAYPSGHTTFGYTEAMLLALMVPERFRALVFRASEYGNSRIVLGAHYPVDVIAGRTLATYDLAQALAGKDGYGTIAGTTFQAKLAEAAQELRTYLRDNGCRSLAHCAREPIARAEDAAVLNDGRTEPSTASRAYAFRLNYGLTPMGATDRPPQQMPVAAGFLLQSRFPYLVPEQRGDVLRSTEGPSGHFLDVDPVSGKPLADLPSGPASQVGAYARIDLFAAGGGYGSFSDRVVVEQDPTKVSDPKLQPFADFARDDTWSNDISGPGGLTKRGAGTLTLAGHNTFASPTLIEGGTVSVTGSVTSATTVEAGGTLAVTGRLGDVYVLDGGSFVPGPIDAGDKPTGGVDLDGSLALAGGSTLAVRDRPAAAIVRIKGHVVLDAPKLVVKAKLAAGDSLTLLEVGDGIIGKFGSVTLADPTLEGRLDYKKDRVTLTVVAKGSGPD